MKEEQCSSDKWTNRSLSPIYLVY